MRFWAIVAAASCAPSTPPLAAARAIRLAIVPVAGRPRTLKNLKVASSDNPTGVPSSVARLRSSSVAPAARARSEASPAPRPAANTRGVVTAIPSKRGAVATAPPGSSVVAAKPPKEPRASPNLPLTVSSRPTSAWGFRPYAAPRIASRVGASNLSGSNEANPSAPVSKAPTPPRAIPLGNSPR